MAPWGWRLDLTNQLRSLRAVEPDAAERRSPVVHCTHPGCSEPTNGRKPLCTAHVLLMPYAQGVRRDVEQLELERVPSRGQCDLTSLLATEILRCVLDRGRVTVERVARDCSTTPAVVRSYFRAFEQAGSLSLSRTRRGTVVAELADQVLPGGRSETTLRGVGPGLSHCSPALGHAEVPEGPGLVAYDERLAS